MTGPRRSCVPMEWRASSTWCRTGRPRFSTPPRCQAINRRGNPTAGGAGNVVARRQCASLRSGTARLRLADLDPTPHSPHEWSARRVGVALARWWTRRRPHGGGGLARDHYAAARPQLSARNAARLQQHQLHAACTTQRRERLGARDCAPEQAGRCPWRLWDRFIPPPDTFAGPRNPRWMFVNICNGLR